MSILWETGLGSCLILATGLIGVPLVWWRDSKKKPVAATTGQNI